MQLMSCKIAAFSFFKEENASGLSNHLDLSAKNQHCGDKRSVVPSKATQREKKKKPVANLQQFLQQ